jgi:alpha-tubulin suppressor-like RCC1 family protein
LATPGDDGGQPVTDYVIQYSSDGTIWNTFDDGISTAASTTVTGLVRSTSYQFRAAQTTIEGTSPFSTPVNATPSTVPDSPTNISFIGKTSTSISLTWTAPIDDGGQPITDYKVEYSTDETNWTTFSHSPSTTTSMMVTGLTRGIPHQVRVRAVNIEGESSPAQEVTSAWANISAGNLHTCAIKTDGTLWCWGYNEYGRLGTGDQGQRPTPTQIPGTTWNTIDVGDQHSCATKTDGTLWCWGNNENGQLGTGDTNSRFSPTQIPGTTWSSVESGGYHSCATKTDNTLWCWGYNAYGQLGSGDTTNRNSPTQIPGTNWRMIAGGYFHHTCATKSDNTLWCWGFNAYGELGTGDTTNQNAPTQIPGTTWETIIAGGYHSCATKTDNTLWCWGLNAYSQLGTGDTTNRNSPTQIPGTTWETIFAGGLVHMCATKTDDTLWCWGYNLNGQLGIGDITDRSTPAQIPGTTWKTIAAGGEHTCAIKTDGTLWCWGYNWKGQIGTSDTNNRSTPTQIGGVTYASLIPAARPSAPTNVAVTSKTETTVALSWTAGDDGGRPITDYVIQYSSNGTIWNTFDDETSIATSTTITGLTRSTNYQFRVAQITIEGSSTTTTTSGVPAIVPSPPTDIRFTGRTNTSISITWSAPDDDGGQPITDYLVEYSINGTNSWATFVREISTITNATITGLNQGVAYQVRVSAVNIEGESSPAQEVTSAWANISTDDWHTCATKTDDTLWCWGYNGRSQLGTGDTNIRTTPTQITGTNW